MQAHCHAFSADTDVATPNGDIPISEVEIGDTVYAYSEVTGEVEEHEVVNTFVHDDDQIVYLTIDGEDIETTPWVRVDTALPSVLHGFRLGRRR